MSELENMKDLVSKLSNKKRNNIIYDRTDTMSIVSAQSSIFDLDSSMSSRDFEDLPKDVPDSVETKKTILPFKTRPYHFKNKKPENWLYSHPKNDTIYERSENPIEWMRTIFDNNSYETRSSKSNLKQQLSKSHGNLYNNIDFDIPDYVETAPPSLVTYKSVSDLKNISPATEDMYGSQSNMTLSKTAPGSTENVDTRSSFQDFIALAKQQEEKLKAEVMRRKSEMSKTRSSVGSRTVPTMKYIKNGHLATTRNRFGFGGTEKPEVTTRYTKKEPPACPPRLSLQTADNTKRSPQKFRYNIHQKFNNRLPDDVKLHRV